MQTNWEAAVGDVEHAVLRAGADVGGVCDNGVRTQAHLDHRGLQAEYGTEEVVDIIEELLRAQRRLVARAPAMWEEPSATLRASFSRFARAGAKLSVQVAGAAVARWPHCESSTSQRVCRQPKSMLVDGALAVTDFFESGKHQRKLGHPSEMEHKTDDSEDKVKRHLGARVKTRAP